jgi:ABC-2 type transport system permease protein
MIDIKKHKFLFEELVKRDFKRKYKRTILGMLWSLLSPLLTLLVMALVFTGFFGRTTQHYIVYLFAGNIIYQYFRDATNGGMNSLIANSGIFTKVNVPKYLFLLSRNVSSLINFGLTLVVFFILVGVEGIRFKWIFLLLVYPTACLVIFNIGVGFILSAIFVFYKDIQYLYDIFTLLLMYLSAIFYRVDAFPVTAQKFFMLNPLYVYISYFRSIVINHIVPGFETQVLCIFYAVLVAFIGAYMYKKYNYKFLYYV